MKLIGQEEVWENIKKANAIAARLGVVPGRARGLIGFVRRSPTLFVDALQSLELDGHRARCRARSCKVGAASSATSSATSSAGPATQVWNLLEIIFEVVAPGAMGYIEKAGAALQDDPQEPARVRRQPGPAPASWVPQFAENFVDAPQARRSSTG